MKYFPLYLFKKLCINPVLLFLHRKLFVLQMQLSEVIARTRKYFKEVTGSSEHIVAENVTPTTIAHKLEYLNIKTDSEEVKKWLQNMDYDRKGFVYFS